MEEGTSEKRTGRKDDKSKIVSNFDWGPQKILNELKNERL